MSVCVSSSSTGGIVGGMTMSHGLTTNMMHPLPHQMHQPSMIPNGIGGNGIIGNGIIDHVNTMGATPTENQDHPNPDMLLALIARNKGLEGEFAVNFSFDLLNKQILLL